MVVLNECRIDDAGKHLIIDAAVENLDYYKNVGIAGIIIDTQDTFTGTGPSNRALVHLSYEVDNEVVITDTNCVSSDSSEDNCECSNIYTGDAAYKKHVRVVLTPKELGVSLNNLFFVYIVCNGIPSSNTPCSMDNLWTMGVAVHLKPIYDKAMSYIKELESGCKVPKGFIDMFLKLKAFKISLKTGNFFEAIRQWKLLVNNRIISPSTKNCGCHGIN